MLEKHATPHCVRWARQMRTFLAYFGSWQLVAICDWLWHLMLLSLFLGAFFSFCQIYSNSVACLADFVLLLCGPKDTPSTRVAGVLCRFLCLHGPLHGVQGPCNYQHLLHVNWLLCNLIFPLRKCTPAFSQSKWRVAIFGWYLQCFLICNESTMWWQSSIVGIFSFSFLTVLVLIFAGQNYIHVRFTTV